MSTLPYPTPVRRASDWQLCVAPMMDWTDRHCRVFHRRLAPRARLYTEMVTAAAVLHGDRERLLRFDASEHPVALQLGGSEPAELAVAARIGREFGYDEINLNCGCPSDRVQAGRFGACLMREPGRVADCIAAMREAVDVPVTVKCRLGVDEHDDWASFIDFVDTVAGQGGCSVFIVHARKAWLAGLSPRDNREIPPLDYQRVQRLKRERPALTVVLNGGLSGCADSLAQLAAVDGVMLGRAAYQTPWVLAELSAALHGQPLPERAALLASLRDYVEAELAAGTALKHITRHWLGLYQGLPGARAFRRRLSEGAHRPGAGWSLVEEALAAVSRRAA